MLGNVSPIQSNSKLKGLQSCGQLESCARLHEVFGPVVLMEFLLIFDHIEESTPSPTRHHKHPPVLGGASPPVFTLTDENVARRVAEDSFVFEFQTRPYGHVFGISCNMLFI